eukprot:TRINITY_DN12719_c0_g1_i1.p1 TRINITY_DN12719_c0_g1~~TRINITY_DN12719_c0_g1_i1.p1  ORF type:complete len:183 (+),score=59.27 TRINITY_DN12719_c0_g1_i1:140-688(+)
MEDYVPKTSKTELTPSKMDKLEETSRKEMSEITVDPVAIGQKAQVQQELLKETPKTAPNGTTMSKVDETLETMRENINSMVSDVADLASVAVAKTQEVANRAGAYTNKELTYVFDKSAVVVEQAIGQFGLGKPGSQILEEHERQRRMSDPKVDPVVQAKKRHVERELLDTVNDAQVETVDSK